jgi:homoserine kinase type II
MAVFTNLDNASLHVFWQSYGLPSIAHWQGIAEGVENSNFLLNTASSQYILTLFERRTNTAALPFFVATMEHLAANGLSCPTPIRDVNGEALQELMGRKALVTSFLEGRPAASITPHHCQQLGGWLAAMHLKSKHIPNAPAIFGLPQWQALRQKIGDAANKVVAGSSDALMKLFNDLENQQSLWNALPAGIIHGDAFPDNVFFDGGQLSGVIDWYFASHGAFAYDLAIALNAWCFDENNQHHAALEEAMLAGYQSVRPLTSTEQQALPWLHQAACVRFFITRLHDWLFPPADALVTAKDPTIFWQRLQVRLNNERPINQ